MKMPSVRESATSPLCRYNLYFRSPMLICINLYMHLHWDSSTVAKSIQNPFVLCMAVISVLSDKWFVCACLWHILSMYTCQPDIKSGWWGQQILHEFCCPTKTNGLQLCQSYLLHVESKSVYIIRLFLKSAHIKLKRMLSIYYPNAFYVSQILL